MGRRAGQRQAAEALGPVVGVLNVRVLNGWQRARWRITYSV
jgi:hypothetical protein